MDYLSSFSSIFSGLGDLYPPMELHTRVPLQADRLLSGQIDPELLRFGVGVIGNLVALLLYSAPILTFKRVIKERSTGEFSCVPYITALFNCLIYTWYGSPMVSNKWDNLPLFTINGVGVLLEASFVLTYILFSSPRGKKTTSLMMAPVIAFTIGMVVLTSILNDLHLRKALVGSFGLVACIAMYCSPLVVVKRVIQTKSVEFMPFSLSLFSFLASSLWTAYGLLSNDLFLAFPNLLGCPLGLLQLLLHCRYSGKPGPLEEPLKVDVEEQAPLKINIEEKREPFKVDLVAQNEKPLLLDVQRIISESFRLVEVEEINEIRRDLSTPLIISVCA